MPLQVDSGWSKLHQIENANSLKIEVSLCSKISNAKQIKGREITCWTMAKGIAWALAEKTNKWASGEEAGYHEN